MVDHRSRQCRNFSAIFLCAFFAALPQRASAEDFQGGEVVVRGHIDKPDGRIESEKTRSSDTAALLAEQPGVSLQVAGGVSGIPVIHGLADDRLRIKVDGMELIACCPNHMNPALSYLEPARIGEISVYTGVMPVSFGGDSIGGTIVAETPAAEFAGPGQQRLFKGSAGTFYRSNGNARGGDVSLTGAGENLSFSYSGSFALADDYRAGGSFRRFTATGNPGEAIAPDIVGSSAYETQNHAFHAALRNSDNLYEISLAYQHIPMQLYPNQRMDMLDNKAFKFNMHYLGQKTWGKLDVRVYGDLVDHYMDFGKDKQLVYGSPPYVVAQGMPMYTKGKTFGASARSDLDLSARDQLRLGLEIQTFRLDDWWPPSPSDLSGMLFSAANPVQATYAGMAPDTFWNINGGKRDRFGFFGEWESKWSPELLTILGARLELVRMDTGTVQGYNSVAGNAMYSGGYLVSAQEFNALDRHRNDVNLDMSALTRFRPDEHHTFELGIAQKTRSPNLYERYSWSRNAMALVMNNYVGDGNGYLGNPGLKPEIAHTLSAAASWHSEDERSEFRVVPYLTCVSDYVDAVQWNRTTNTAGQTPPGQFGILKYMNQRARLYGLDVSGKAPIGMNPLGSWTVRGQLSYVHGRNLDTGSGLYNVMPLNGRLWLQQQSGVLTTTFEMVAVSDKTDISRPRQELPTSGYVLFNLKAGVDLGKVRLDAGVDNLFDRLYFPPNGGAYTGQGTTMSLAGIPYGIAVPGPGRSLYVGMHCKW